MSYIVEFLPIMLIIIAISFVFELLDASIGIGFGTAVTPILLIIGFDVSIVVPSILLSELAAGAVAIIFHALLRNVRLGKKRIFRRRRRKSRVYVLPGSEQAKSSPQNYSNDFLESKLDDFNEIEEIEEEIIVVDEKDLDLIEDDEIEEIKFEKGSLIDRFKNLTTDTKVIIILSFFGIIASIIAAVLNVVFDYNHNFNFSVKIYISIMVLAMGILTLVFRNKTIKFSIKRIISLGAVAGFNKGLSGGGYRPVTVMGQLLSGRNGKNALASTTFSKTAVSFVGVLAYIITHIVDSLASASSTITWEYLGLAPYLLIGAIIAAPLGALVTKKVESKWLKITIGWGTICLGIFSIIRLTLFELGIWDKIPSLVEDFLT
ncbi:MAG: TSUP family transporter [Asgard group archaeon]|nr:TSUP family transporter [Asgard group archaeon]